MEKASSYAKQVKEMYWPKVSEAKKLELEQIKEQLKSQNVRRSVADLKIGEQSSTNGKAKLQPLRSGRGLSSNVYKSNTKGDESSHEYYNGGLKDHSELDMSNLNHSEQALESTRAKRRPIRKSKPPQPK